MGVGWTGITDTIGAVGDITMLVVYIWVQTGRISATQYTYLLGNVLGAAAGMLTLVSHWSLWFCFVEVMWLFISLNSLIKLTVCRRMLKRGLKPPAGWAFE
ncbi:MAG: hypothetical protein V4490_04330 [Pseudomonadota bacterium]